MESETTEINYWQRSRINLNLAKSRQLRVHAEKRRLGRCRFMHMPRRRRLRDWDKITSGSTRSSFLAHKHPPHLRPVKITTSTHRPPRLRPTHPYPSLLFALTHRLYHRHIRRGRVYIRTDYMRTRPRLLPLGPRGLHVYLYMGCR